MRNTLLLLVSAAVLSSCATTMHQETGFLDRSIAVNGTAYPYSVYVPRKFDRSRQWPVILFLHGAGERGEDGLRPTQVGLGTAIRFDPSRIPAVVVFPQAPEMKRWLDEPADAALAALDRTIAEFNGDPKRVYVAGLSMGGYGSLHLALADPRRFAAAVVICGGLRPSPKTTAVAAPPETRNAADPYMFAATRLRDLPLWLFHGTDDPVVPVEESRRLYAALQNLGARDVHYTEYPATGHNTWDKAFADASMWAWLFTKRR